ncbi:MAG: DMT family transporter [Thermodesulfovibrionales bacterium]|nr:DMT family transporter [Thermodesulfovibrionales bacterium]
MLNSWVYFALLSALTLSLSDALVKKALKEYPDEYTVAWLRLSFSLPLLFVSFLFIEIPPLSLDFFIIFILALPLEIFAIILYIKALKISPLSVTLPFLSLTPLFLILISYLILGESVSISGGIGILLIVTGGYLLHIREFKKGILEPFVAIKREKGSVYMILVSLIYALTSSLGKKAIELSSPIFFANFFFIIVTILLTPLALLRKDCRINLPDRKVIKTIILPGFLYSLMIISHVLAMSLTQVAYVIAVKRLSLIIGVLLGYFIFKETNIHERMLGSILMFTGFIIIMLYH